MVRLIIEMEDTLVEVRSTSTKTIAEKKGSLDVLKDYKKAADWQDKVN